MLQVVQLFGLYNGVVFAVACMAIIKKEEISDVVVLLIRFV